MQVQDREAVRLHKLGTNAFDYQVPHQSESRLVASHLTAWSATGRSEEYRNVIKLSCHRKSPCTRERERHLTIWHVQNKYGQIQAIPRALQSSSDVPVLLLNWPFIGW